MRFGVVLIATFVVAQLQQSDWNLRDHIPLADVVVQSHRGAGTLMPENSVEAFELAWSLGTIPEADLRTTKDGVIVAFHDKNFQRILPHAPEAERNKGVEGYSWSELSNIDIGSWKGDRFNGQRIPRMKDVYSMLTDHPERRLYIDIKNVDLEQLSKESHKVHQQLILASTDYAIIREWKRLAPASFTLHWMGGTETELGKRLQKLEKGQFADITQLQIHVHIDENGIFSPSEKFLLETGNRLREYGVLYQVLPWESKSPQVFWRLMDIGVGSFATDYPNIAMQAIQDYYKKGMH